jgi:hypothetical protein
MTELHLLIEGSRIGAAVGFIVGSFLPAIEDLGWDERGHRDRYPTISRTKAERHKPSYRFVAPLDAQRLPALN